WPILAGILVATLANHAMAATVGAVAGQFFEGPWVKWVLGAAFIAFAAWVIILRRSGYVSLASILASFVLGLVNTLVTLIHAFQYAASTSVEGHIEWLRVGHELVRRGDTNLTLLSWVVAVFVVWKHRANIQRLRAGTEYRFGSRGGEEAVRLEGVEIFRQNAKTSGLDPDRVVVLGAGSWGIAIAQILAVKGLRVTMWEYSEKVAQSLRETRELPDKLPGVRILDSIEITSDMAKALEGASVVCMIVPSHTLRSVCNTIKGILSEKEVAARQWVSFIKGIEEKTLKRMTEIVIDVLPGATDANVSVLSGPSHAEEVARQVPTTVVLANSDETVAAALQDMFFLAPFFRTYRSTDVVGVELCGAVKNVMAI
ncbi:MAG TPA: glycerol-3-phosphate acyltransferase, partial [Fibrobacteria bacterium]|nr:glycerol-3-phosphate acyltransferase [Fibrobacteria bacterium]